MAASPLKFDGKPFIMAACILPYMLMGVLVYSLAHHKSIVAAYVGSIVSGVVSFMFGISPAFFRRTDHPLHYLDRWRWRIATGSFIGFILLAFRGKGALYSFLHLNSPARITLSDYMQAPFSYGGHVQLVDVMVDMVKIGSATHCNEQCSQSECVTGTPCLNESVSSGWNWLWRSKGCKITCLYAAPILEHGSSAVPQRANNSTPVAWAVSVDYMLQPSFVDRALVGTPHSSWWFPYPNAYHMAVEDSLNHFLNLSSEHAGHLWGRAPVGTPHFSYVYDDQHGYQVAIEDSSERPANPSPQHAPTAVLFYLLQPEAGKFAFLAMMPLALAMLPLQWAWVARWRWATAEPTATSSFLRYHRKIIGRSNTPESLNSSVSTFKIHATLMSGETKNISGLHPHSYLVNLRRKVSKSYGWDFLATGLIFGEDILPHELDFQTLDKLGLSDGSTVSVVNMPGDATPKREKLAGMFESSALSFFGRRQTVYKALTCSHGRQLRRVHAPLEILDRYNMWKCDGCEYEKDRYTQPSRCDFCRIHLCQECTTFLNPM